MAIWFPPWKIAVRGARRAVAVLRAVGYTLSSLDRAAFGLKFPRHTPISERLVWVIGFAPGVALAAVERALTGGGDQVMAMARAGEKRPVLFLYSAVIYALIFWLVCFVAVPCAWRLGLPLFHARA